MSRLLLSALLVLTVALTSCTMSQVQMVPMGERQSSSESEVIGHIHANSWGIYFFGSYPYLSGGIDGEGKPEWAYWQDKARVETAVNLIRAEALRQGATHLVDLQSNWISEWLSFTLIFWIAEAEASATAIRVKGDPPEGAISL